LLRPDKIVGGADEIVGSVGGYFFYFIYNVLFASWHEPGIREGIMTQEVIR